MNASSRLQEVDYLILALFSPSHAQEYLLDRNSQNETWVKKLTSNFRVFWIVGDPNLKDSKLDFDILYVPCQDSQIIQKSYLAFAYFIGSFNFKYIIRTNTSTFFFVNQLIDLLNKMSKLDVDVAGFPLGISLRSLRKSMIYCSGASIFLSQKAVLRLLEFGDRHSNLPDDVEISRTVADFFPIYWIFRSDLELFPLWRPRPVVRLKHPFDSYKTSALMYQMGNYDNSKSKKQKFSVYWSFTLPLIWQVIKNKRGFAQTTRSLTILLKSSVYIRISNAKFILKAIF